MNKLNEKALEEARQIVENLSIKTPKGKLFQSEDFIQGLSEEIESFWQPGVTEGIASFHLVEDGSLEYCGLSEKTTEQSGPENIIIPFSFKPESVKEEISDEQLDFFTLLSSMKESHCKEKSKILESLDQISVEFDKKLIETIRKAKTTKNPNTTKIAEEYLNLDIAAKKQKLLEKLLEGK